MTNITKWAAGAGLSGLSWTARTTLFGTADLTSLADSKAVLSSASALTNGTSLDQYVDLSVEITVASSTPRAGAFIGIWLAALAQDGTTLGDGQLVAGTQTTYLPPWDPWAMIPIANQAMTLMAGFAGFGTKQNGLLLPPGSWLPICYNFTNVSFSGTAANNVVAARVYDQNLNG